jgi:Skp family chaperone for outer membrane proteins
MKLICTVAAAVIFTALTVLVVSARKSDALLQPAQTLPDSKVAIVDTEEFGDAKTGVTRLVNAFSTLERDMKPKRDELQQLQARYDQLVKEINATTAVADQKTIASKAEQAESLQKDIKRKQEDGQRDMDKRVKDLTEPIYTDISDALQAFAKQRGVSVIVDISKFRGAMMVVNDQIDITKAFITDYNSKHPAAAAPAAAPAGTPKP